MHILIAFITAVTGLLYIVERLGIDIGWINPWAWSRRRRWIKQLHVNPAFNLDSPMEAAALLLIATARIDGDLSSEEKGELKQIFQEIFKQSEKEASELMVSSTYLLGSGEEVFQRPDDVIARSLEKFSEEQKSSTIGMLERIANVGSPPSESQTQFIADIKEALNTREKKEDW